MSDFAEKKCVSCESGLPPLDYKEIHKYLKKVNGWDVKTNEKKTISLKKNLFLKILLKVKNL